MRLTTMLLMCCTRPRIWLAAMKCDWLWSTADSSWSRSSSTWVRSCWVVPLSWLCTARHCACSVRLLSVSESSRSRRSWFSSRACCLKSSSSRSLSSTSSSWLFSRLRRASRESVCSRETTSIFSLNWAASEEEASSRRRSWASMVSCWTSPWSCCTSERRCSFSRCRSSLSASRLLFRRIVSFTELSFSLRYVARMEARPASSSSSLARMVMSSSSNSRPASRSFSTSISPEAATSSLTRPSSVRMRLCDT
mmetsp:Transcript_20551/g.49045  ORF Transcript_20551/g.49045 Transcript_20551/m.49045 type:complete len:252 (-) Transcript_20551:1105-1860(-)